jgi:hypothetical protein
MAAERAYPRQSGDSSREQAREYERVRPCNESCLLRTRGKKTRWQKLRDALIPYLKSSRRLAEVYAEAAVQKERSEAQKIAGEAAEIAARKDLIKQKEVKEFSSNIDDIFAVNDLPPVAKALKLAKLMENNPQIEAHIGAAQGLLQELSLREFIDAPHKSLPPPQRKSNEQD